MAALSGTQEGPHTAWRGDGRVPHDEGDEVAKFFVCFWQLQVEAARRKFGKESGWKPKQFEVAHALGVASSTVGHWRKEENFPREEMFRSVLTLADVSYDRQVELLALRSRAHPLWEARGSAPPPEPEIVPSTETAPGCPDIPAPASTDEEERHSPPRIPSCREELDDPLTKAAAALATKIRVQWDEEAADRGLDIPPPIPPRWARTQLPVTSSIDVAVAAPTYLTRFPALPGSAPATVDMARGGGLAELFDLYAGLGSGRIILMGHYGSGKTATAILMLLDALDRRVGLAPDRCAQTPVPVLLTAQDWDPFRQDLGDWFTEQLAAVYDFLQSPEYGTDAAAGLVRGGQVALFLDGFDEMDEKLRAEALRRINRQRRAFRLVVLTRIDDFIAVVEAENLHLHGAVALELRPVTPEHAITYLKGYQRFPVPDGDELQRLIDHLRQRPDDPVSQALDVPLNLILVREDPHAVNELLASGRFRTRDQVESYLLGRVVPVAYGRGQRPDPTPAEAQRWLGYLATQMKRNDLAWWHMHHWAPTWERLFLNTVVGVVLMSGIGALVFGPVGQYAVTGHTGVLFGAGYGATMGSVFGFMATLISEFREPRPSRRRPPRRMWRLPHGAVNPAIGFFIFAVVTMAVGNQGSYRYGPFAGFVAACVAGHAATRVRTTSRTRSLWWRLRPNGTDLLSALVIGLPVGLTYGLTKTLMFGAIAGLITGFTFGFMTSMARSLADTDAPTSPDTRWRHDLHRTLLVGATAGIPIGLALGFQNGRTHGLLAGVTTALGIGAVIAIGSMIGISDVWRTTLLFVQLRLRGVFPVHGMRFLNHARQRQVLRTAGPKFQFKHDRLRAALAETYRSPVEMAWSSGVGGSASTTCRSREDSSTV
jgi:MFS family permease